MPALIPSGLTGRILWLGRLGDRARGPGSQPATELVARFDGVAGDAHGGLTRPSCSRVTAQFAPGTEIRNTRQFSVLSAEELAEIASDMGLDRLDPAWLGASMVVEGIADFSHLPPSSRLQGNGGATLVVDMQNRPCNLPAPVIEAAAPGFGKYFKPAARDRRGVTAWVEREGVFRIGEVLQLHVPDQRAWHGGKAKPSAPAR